jgi:hypothetical protein
MRIILRIGVVLAACFVLAAPVQAFSAETLVFDVRENGDTQVSFGYTLSWLEYMAVYLHIADPATELDKALEGSLGHPVTVSNAGTKSADFTVYGLANVYGDANSTTIMTPGVSFTEAETVLERYWFAQLVRPDFSPKKTIIRFPDGFELVYRNVATIPPVVHTLGTA